MQNPTTLLYYNSNSLESKIKKNLPYFKIGVNLTTNNEFNKKHVDFTKRKQLISETQKMILIIGEM